MIKVSTRKINPISSQKYQKMLLGFYDIEQENIQNRIFKRMNNTKRNAMHRCFLMVLSIYLLLSDCPRHSINEQDVPFGTVTLWVLVKNVRTELYFHFQPYFLALQIASYASTFYKLAVEKQKEGAPGFEPGTSRSAVECSTTELYPQLKYKWHFYILKRIK